MKSATLFCSVIAAASLSVPANADDGRMGFASSASTTITVIIPPLQAGIDATQEGAVGLWTLEPGSAGLMVKIPDTLAAGQSSDLDVFRASGNLFDVSLPAGTGFRLTPSTRTENKGMLRQHYVLSNDGLDRRDALQVVIRGI